MMDRKSCWKTVALGIALASLMNVSVRAASDAPHVLLIMIDALRPDHIGAWGNVRTRTPNLDRIASQGVFFRNIFAPMPSSAPSRATIFTGRAPHTHGVRVNGRTLPKEERTLPEVFQEAGYTTVSVGPVSHGREQGFRHLNVAAVTGGPDSLARVMWDELVHAQGKPIPEGRNSRAIQAALGWFRDHRDDEAPTFMWLDMPENLHEPWRPPAPYDTMYDSAYHGRDVSVNPMYSPDLTEREIRHAHALYDGQLSYVDAQLGVLFDGLARLGLEENTILVIMSDHGTFMGEHSLWQKPPILLDPVMRATLIIRYPPEVPAGVQTAHLAQLSDVFATVLDLAGLPIPEPAATSSRSLRPLWERNEPVRDAVYMEFCRYKGTAAKAIRTQRWLYVYMRSIGTIPWSGGISPAEVFRALGWPSHLLFDVQADPALGRNIVEEHPDVETHMRFRLLDWLIDSENDVPWEE